jgi:hypothetical protein
MLMPFVAAGGNVVQMDERSRVVGMQAIVSHLFAERDITPLWNELMQRVTQDGTDASATPLAGRRKHVMFSAVPCL